MLQYAGRVSAMKSMKYADLVPLFLMRTGLPKDTQLQVYEEVKFEPALMCDLQVRFGTLLQPGLAPAAEHMLLHACPVFEPDLFDLAICCHDQKLVIRPMMC